MVPPARPTDLSLPDVPRGMLAAALLSGLESLIGLAGPGMKSAKAGRPKVGHQQIERWMS